MFKITNVKFQEELQRDGWIQFPIFPVRVSLNVEAPDWMPEKIVKFLFKRLFAHVSREELYSLQDGKKDLTNE